MASPTLLPKQSRSNKFDASRSGVCVCIFGQHEFVFDSAGWLFAANHILGKCHMMAHLQGVCRLNGCLGNNRHLLIDQIRRDNGKRALMRAEGHILQYFIFKVLDVMNFVFFYIKVFVYFF